VLLAVPTRISGRYPDPDGALLRRGGVMLFGGVLAYWSPYLAGFLWDFGDVFPHVGAPISPPISAGHPPLVRCA